MDRELLEAVIDRSIGHLSFTPGWVDGYAVETALGYTFPTLVPRGSGRVNGIITHGLADVDVERIAYFEDTEYQPVHIDVATPARHVPARVFMSTQTLNTTGEVWDFENWRTQHKPLLIAITRRVMREHYGVTPFAEIDAHWHRIHAELEAEIVRKGS